MTFAGFHRHPARYAGRARAGVMAGCMQVKIAFKGLREDKAPREVPREAPK